MLVTIYGSSGFVGRNLAKRLVAHGDEVQGIDPAGDAVSPRLLPDPRAKVIVFLAQSPHYRRLPEMAWHLFAVNVAAAVQAAQQALAVGATRFIYASSGSVYAPSFEPLSESSPLRRDGWYALSKVQAEEALTLFVRADAPRGAGGLDITIVRPFCIFGPGQTNMLVPNLLDSILAGRPIYAEPGADASDRDGLRISPCCIDDAVEILCTMIHRGMGVPPMSSQAKKTHGRDARATPEIVNLAGPEVISIRELATELGRLAGKAPNIEISPRRRQGDLIADLTLLRRAYEPQFTPLAAALERTVEARRHRAGETPAMRDQAPPPSEGQP